MLLFIVVLPETGLRKIEITLRPTQVVAMGVSGLQGTNVSRKNRERPGMRKVRHGYKVPPTDQRQGRRAARAQN